MIQLREKELSSLEFYNQAVAVKQVTDKYHIPLIINDRIDIAMAVQATGVHIGQHDLPAAAVRKVIGENMLLGVSASSIAEAIQAQQDGADYLGVGAMFPTGTKTDADSVSMEELQKIRAAVSLPMGFHYSFINQRIKSSLTENGVWKSQREIFMERNEKMKSEIVLFTDGDVNIEVQINPEQETVWLTQKQMEALFEVKRATVSKHISNILASGELDETSVGFSDRSTGGRKPKIYNLDMILSVGYRVHSKRGIAFRKWVNSVLKQFILKGYALNENHLQALRKTVDIQSRMLVDALDIEEKNVLRAINEYTDALILLDQYDHQALSKPEGSTPIYRITYEDCVQMVGQMKDSFETDVFGVEKETGKVEGIIAAVYQSVFGQDAYPSLEEKAANLLYFMIKDHPYADGCKRIAASLFLEFLDKNNALFQDGEKRLSDGTLVAITLMIAESKAEEKDVMVKLVMNLLRLN